VFEVQTNTNAGKQIHAACYPAAGQHTGDVLCASFNGEFFLLLLWSWIVRFRIVRAMDSFRVRVRLRMPELERMLRTVI